MKAVYINAPGEVEIRQVEMPVRKPGEALLKVLYGGICGSDLGSYRGTFAYFSYPRIPGHEFSAEIVEIEENEYGLENGMIVTCNPYFNCGSCYSCQRGVVNACMDNQTMGCQRDGAFCEYITMPIERIYDGKGLSAKVLAAIEPFCISYHGVQRAGVKKVIAKTTRDNYRELVRETGIDSTISPKDITANKISKYVRGLVNSEGSVVESLYKLLGGKIEAVEFTAKADSRIVNMPLKDLPLRKGLLVASIVRGQTSIIPNGMTEILPGDHVIVMAKSLFLHDINEILEH